MIQQIDQELKLLPNDKDAEQSVLGSLLIDGDAIHEVENLLKPKDFYYPVNEHIFQACINLRERRESINQVTLAHELNRLGKLKDIGGTAFLSYLISICGTSLDIEHYARIVRRLSISRKMIELGEKISGQGYKDIPDTNSAIDDIYNQIVEFKKTNLVTDEIISPKQASDITMDLYTEYQSERKSINYGFVDLDNETSGIFPELIIVGARPSVGKTQLMLDLVENIAQQKRTVLFCSIEMGIKSIMERKIARELGIDIREIRKGMTLEKEKAIVDVSGLVSEQSVYYLPQGMSSNDIYAEAKKLLDTVGLDIVFVDYLQILRDCWDSNRDNQVVRVGRACKILKSIVNDLGIPVVAASQLNRASEYRTGENRFPKLADLRESGDIEQDADVVFLLHRDKETDENFGDKYNSNILRVQMAKNRQLGWSRAIELLWDEKSRRYVSLYKGR